MGLSKACPECQKNGHDKTGNHLFLMKDNATWCCMKADYHDSGEAYYEGQLAERKKQDEDETVDDVDNFAALLYEHSGPPDPTPVSPTTQTGVPTGIVRGITPDVLKKYGVRALYVGGTLVELEHDVFNSEDGKVITQKVRKLPKDFFTRGKTGKGTPIQFFGQSIFPRAKRILITEGELDAMSAWIMLSKYRVACVSLPFGANVKAIVDNLQYLKGFKEVIFCLDQDKSGEDIKKPISALIPRAKFMKISEKDANDMLTGGKQAEFVSAFWDAEIYQPSTIVRVTDILDKVLQKPQMGEPWPWPTLTEKTYGRNEGQGIYVGAGVKIGKSEFINQVVTFDVMRGQKIAVLKYEEPPFMTVKRVAGKIDHIAYHRPGVHYDVNKLKDTAMKINPLLLMYPAFGPATWESTKDFIRYAAVVGCKTIIIDPVTKLTNSLSSSDTETELRKLSDEIACLAQDMGFFYIITCHLKAPTNGPPHEMGGRVMSNQFRGSRAMMENTFYMLGIQRNKDPGLPEVERNTSKFVLLEDRNFGNACEFPVIYDPITQDYLEPTGGIF